MARADTNHDWRLLIVEDDPDQAETVSRLLEKKFSATAEKVPSLATARAALSARPFDLVILDYQLPDGSGLDLLKEITSEEGHPLVVMVTGQGGEEIAASAFRLRASGYVVKDSRLASMLPEVVSLALNEAALNKARARMLSMERNESALLNATNETLILLEADGTIDLINRTGAERFGLTPEEMVGTNIFEDGYMPEELSGRRREHFGRVLSEFEPVSFEDEREGRVLGTVMYPVFGTGRRVERVVIFAQDITRRRMAEEELQRSREELEERVLERTTQLREANEELRGEIEDRKRIEQSLTALSQRFQEQARVLDQILSAPSNYYFFLLDEKGKFIYASTPAAAMLGLEQPAIAGKYWWELGFPESAMREVDVQRENVMKTGEPWTGEVEFPTGQGIRDFDYTLTPIFSPDGSVDTVVITARDVTEAKKDREDARRYLERVQEQAQLLDLTHETVLVRSMDGTVIFWNAGAEEMYGWKREEALGRNAHDLLKTAWPLPLDELEDELLEQGRWEGELVHSARDGSEVRVSSRQVVKWRDAGIPEAVLEIDYDISERRELEEELEARAMRSEERARLIDFVPFPMVVRDMNNKIVSWSEAAEEAYGWEAIEVLGKDFYELFGIAEDWPRSAVEFELLDKGSWCGSLRRVNREGERIEGSAQWFLAFDKDGAPDSIVDLSLSRSIC